MTVQPEPDASSGIQAAAGSPEAARGQNAFASTAAAAVVGLVLLSALFGVWAWQYGGWFGTALYPGVAVLAAGLALLALFAPARIRVRGWAAVALAAFLALGAWAGLSALWSPAPDVAIQDAQRILAYATAFAVGLWTCALLSPRIHLALVPLAAAGLFAGLITLWLILTGDDLRQLLDRGTLQYPLGYRNANAAFFLIASLPAVGLAASRALDWRLRGLALATATLCLQLGALGQSRGSILGVGAVLVVFVVAHRDRARAVGWLALAVVPALVVVPALTDLYSVIDQRDDAATLGALRDAGRMVTLGFVLSLALGLAAAFAERRRPISDETLRRANRVVAVAAAVVAVTGLAGFAAVTGDPIGWVGDRADEFLTQGSPEGTQGSSRFQLNAGTERDDLWRVALDDARDSPVLGEGAGSFYYSYLESRSAEGVASARDAHSVEMETLGELGIPGLVLLLLGFVAAIAGAVRAARTGAAAAALSGFALVAFTYWFVHASLDWFFPFPALTASVFALLGSACAPALLEARPFRRGPLRWSAVAFATALAVSVVPPYLSERYVDAAYEGWQSDRAQAFRDLDRAEAANPLAEEPMLARGAIARAAGDREAAIEAFEEAARKRPEEWASHYFLAQLFARSDPGRARQEYRTALEQNPLGPRLQDFGERFEGGR
jgi:hypothetical protein